MQPEPPSKAPEKPALLEVPEIVSEYQALVGRAIRSFDGVTKFESRDLNAIAALGRPVTILKALDAASAGGGDLSGKTTQELEAMVASKARKVLPAAEDAQFEEVVDDDE